MGTDPETAENSWTSSEPFEALPRLWATRKIGHLLNQIRLRGPDQETIDQIVRLSIRYGIVTPYTSYLVTEPLPLGEAAQERIAANQYRQLDAESSAPSFGQAAVEKAASQEALAGADRVASPPAEAAQLVRFVGSKTFVNVDGTWMDSTYDPQKMEAVKVPFLSEDYFALGKSRPALAAAFTLGPSVIAVSDDVAYEVIPAQVSTTPIDDLDSRVASIRPPNNVLRAQVIQHPPAGTAPIRNPAGVTVSFSAASNTNDPALAVTPTRAPNTNGVDKSTFWGIATQAYGPLYPAAPLNPFLAPFSLAVSGDLGLPVPTIGGPLQYTQQGMPGLLAPYSTTAGGNAPRSFGPLVGIRPFFTGAAFGYQTSLNAFMAEAIPMTSVDDFGREIPNSLMRVQDRNAADTVIATTDAVVPVSSETNCQDCHAAPSDMGARSRTPIPTNALIAAGLPVTLAAAQLFQF